jgi:D-threo-aldose 1-dehydrogenase
MSGSFSTKVGRLLRPKTDNAFSGDGRLSPMPFDVIYDYGYDAIMRSVEDSYQRLGLARSIYSMSMTSAFTSTDPN